MTSQSESDQELADILAIARKIRVTIHVRGSDRTPIVELRQKGYYPPGYWGYGIETSHCEPCGEIK